MLIQEAFEQINMLSSNKLLALIFMQPFYMISQAKLLIFWRMICHLHQPQCWRNEGLKRCATGHEGC